MSSWAAGRAFITLLIFLVTVPLAAVAQDDKRQEEKKGDRKEKKEGELSLKSASAADPQLLWQYDTGG